MLAEKHRQNINAFLSKSTLQYQRKLNRVFEAELASIIKFRPVILFGVLVGLACFYSKNIMSPGFMSMLLFGVSGMITVVIYSSVVLQLFVLLPVYCVKFIAWFIHRCPKGAVFGVGYLMLMLSFTLRFYETTN